MLELVKMTHICQYWRISLISFPHLWSSVFVKNDHREFVTTCLERSQRVSLTVHLDMKYVNDRNSREFHDCPCLQWAPSPQFNERNLCPHRTAILPLLNNYHTERVRNLDIHLTIVDDVVESEDHILFRSALDNLKFCALSLPSLQTLSLSMHFDFDWYDPPFVDFPGDMFGWDTSPPANLRHLILHSCFGGPILSLQNVTSFELTGANENCFMYLDPCTFLQFISGNPSLVSLTLAYCSLPPRSELPRITPVELSRLKTLRLLDVCQRPSFPSQPTILPCLIEIPALKSLSSLHFSTQQKGSYVGDFRIHAQGAGGFQLSMDIVELDYGESAEEDLALAWLGITRNANPRLSFVRLEREGANPDNEHNVDASYLPLFVNAKVLEISASFADHWYLNLWDDLKEIGPQLTTLRLEVTQWMDTEVTEMFAGSVKEVVKVRLEKGMPLERLERMRFEGMSKEDERKSERLWEEFRASLDIDQYLATE